MKLLNFKHLSSALNKFNNHRDNKQHDQQSEEIVILVGIEFNMSKIYLLLVSLVTTLHVNGQAFTNPLSIPPLLSGRVFTLNCDTGSKQIYPGQPTQTFAISGDILGPTIQLQRGDSVALQINNYLGETTNIHWHGLHVPASMDGGPETIIPSMGAFSSRFVVKNQAGTYWYHPHIHMNTQAQVTRGMAGMILVKDSAEATLDLPRNYGVDDFPVILQDRTYDAYNQIFIGPMGDSMLVNGTASPYLNVPGQVVRLRFLNGSNARSYVLGFNDNSTFTVIASDGGILPVPVNTNRLQINPGERYEIVKDFSNIIGGSIVLKSYATELPNTVAGNILGGMGSNGPLDGVDFDIMELRSISPIPGGVNTLPANLLPVVTWDSLSANRVRDRLLTGQGMIGMGSFYIDGNQYIMGAFNDTMRLGDIELWHVTNYSNISHPMHVHDVSFRILSRNGVAPSPIEDGWKDVFHLLPQETISLIMRFEDYSDANIPYMYHCHNLAHEDMGMMSSFIVVDTNTSAVSSPSETHTMSIYPNPTAESWKLHMPHAQQTTVSIVILDVTGRPILTEVHIVGHEEITISTEGLTSGIYFLKIEKGNGVCEVVRAVKQ